MKQIAIGDLVTVTTRRNITDDTYLDTLGHGVVQSLRRNVAVVRFPDDVGCIVAPVHELRRVGA